MTETAIGAPTEPRAVLEEWDVPVQFARVDASRLYTHRPVCDNGAA